MFYGELDKTKDIEQLLDISGTELTAIKYGQGGARYNLMTRIPGLASTTEVMCLNSPATWTAHLRQTSL